MTREELVKNGWCPKDCKVGVLYLKSGYFIDLRETKARVFSESDDMNPLGEVETLEEVTELQKTHEKSIIKELELSLTLMKKAYEIKYGEKI